MTSCTNCIERQTLQHCGIHAMDALRPNGRVPIVSRHFNDRSSVGISLKEL